VYILTLNARELFSAIADYLLFFSSVSGIKGLSFEKEFCWARAKLSSHFYLGRMSDARMCTLLLHIHTMCESAGCITQRCTKRFKRGESYAQREREKENGQVGEETGRRIEEKRG